MLFVFGLVTGIAATLVFGNLTGLTSAQAVSNSRTATNTAVTQPTTITDPSAAAPSGQLAAVTKDEHIRGDINKAKVVLVEYSDFECPFCGRHHPSMLQAMEDYGDQIAWVYRHYPLSFHPQAMPGALASECADEQGKFWEYADALFANQAALADGYYSTLAGQLGLNQKKFDDCFTSKKYQDKISADQSSGIAAGVSGTPATFVNGQLVSGAVPYETLKAVIDAQLAATK
jgi:protein-disulfide isomerase